jgi:hypothetical protein
MKLKLKNSKLAPYKESMIIPTKITSYNFSKYNKPIIEKTRLTHHGAKKAHKIINSPYKILGIILLIILLKNYSSPNLTKTQFMSFNTNGYLK